MAISSGKPYSEKFLNETTRIRVFEDVNDDELVWHRDRNDRQVTVIEGENWWLQMDDRLPVRLEKDKTYEIPKMVFHRLLKGKGVLTIKIVESKEDK